MGRAEILTLGSQRRPWAFLPIALRALRVAPNDLELRAAIALNLAWLGLVTPARELLLTLPPEARALPDVQRLLAALPTDRRDVIDAQSLIATCRTNLDALLARPERIHAINADDLRARFDAWADALPAQTWLRAVGGNIVRRLAPGSDAWTPESWAPESWLGLADQRAAAASFADHNLAFKPGDMPGPFTIEGIDPPWVLERLLAATPPQPIGYAPRISILQADPRELLDGLAHSDLASHLAHTRVELFVGPDAGAVFERTIASRVGLVNAGPCIVTTGVRARTAPPADAVVSRALAARAEAIESARTRLDAIYGPRDLAWWRDRFRAALSGNGEPLRVLIPTCRYTTFVQHASRDLAGAFERMGLRAEILIEPDDSSRLSATGYLHAIERSRPDLVVLANYTRTLLGTHLPANLPWITWIQDGMQHLFDSKVGRAMGPLDFAAGHIFPELVRDFGYAPDRCMPVPVVADTAKFHPAPVDHALARKASCDVAYVSHHSETPGDMHDRLIRDGAVDRAAVPMLTRIRDAIEAAVASDLSTPIQRTIAAVVARELRAMCGDRPDPALRASVLRQYALPMAERVARHRALQWTSAICARRKWSFRLYGNGWERHPTLAAHAAGPLEHGESLRASYQAARCHLHVSITAPVHQRVMECALSGGLPVVRLHRDALGAPYLRACLAALRRERPHRADHPDNWRGWNVADHPELMALTALTQRLGLPAADAVHCNPVWAEQADAMELSLPIELDPAWLLVDAAAVGFWDESSLERVLDRAITNAPWREAHARAIAARVRSRLTHDVLAARLVALVARSLGATTDHEVQPLDAAPAIAHAA